MLTLTISQADSQRLNYERFHSQSSIIQKRLHRTGEPALFLKATTDFSHQLIAAIVDIHPDTLTDYIRTFNEHGWKGITTLRYGTNHSQLDEHKATLLAAFGKTHPHTVAEAIGQITNLTGLTRSPTQVRHWLHKHGFRYRKTGQIPAKADPHAQACFLTDKLQPAIEQAKNQHIHLLFVDAAHFVMGAFLCHVWCLVRFLLPTPSGRKRLNVLGAVDAITHQIHLLTNQTYITATTIVTFLGQLKAAYGDGKPIWLVMDNARYQHCRLVEAEALRLGITLLFLPPYSPNLNLIERLWKWVKTRCLYGQYYADFGLFERGIMDTLHQANNLYQHELKTLLSLKFQRF